METNLSAIRRAEIRARSGFEIVSDPSIKHVRQGFFARVNLEVSGDAPKDFLRIYEYDRGKKANPNTWPAHIAKVGHKYYPIESVTEHLLTRIGEQLGLNIARSRLMWVRGQLRFLSEYFLGRNESLVHGAEIFSGYLAADRQFVEQVEEMKMSNEIFTFQVVEAAVKSRFPEQADEILQEFVRLIAFDAIVGNNDRHFYNWGVITHVAGDRPPRFSPVYDTARALFWNVTEDGLSEQEHRFEDFLRKYVLGSYPKTGWDRCKSLNHFDLVLKIFEDRPIYRKTITNLYVENLLERVQILLDGEFANLLSPIRKHFISACLKMRLGKYAEIATI